ncbi:MAG: S8 family peptidase [Dethiobacter sp.]|jgi:serine protease AprX|nr:S8 family peptidase [Dethiobacter sp.]
MIIREVGWIRSHADKLCPVLREKAIGWYRPYRYAPCFTQKPLRSFRSRRQKIPVIVQGTENGFRMVSLDLVAKSAGCNVKRKLALINAFSTDVNAQSLKALVENDTVKRIWYDSEVKAVLDIASPTVGSSLLWDDEITGEGIVVAVLDTGIYAHADLDGRIVGFADFVKNRTEPYDDNGHGTHVAGCIAASGRESGAKYRGPAPGARVVGVKVLNKVGMGSLSTVIEGIQWCIDRKNIRIINMSLGSPANMSYVDDPVCQAVEKAWQDGIVVCVAAGNEGPEPQTVGSPGNHPVVITVGASDDMNTMDTLDDKVAGFSSRGPTRDGHVKPDFLAPGVNIVSLRSPGSFIDKQNKQSRVDSWYTSLSGTSMATPVCSGVAAQLLQVNGSLSPDQVKSLLRETAMDLFGLDPNVQGAGMINGQAAAAAAAKKEDK